MFGNEGALAAIVSNMIRVAKVTEVDAARMRARVRIADRDNMPSYWLSVMTKNTMQNHDYWLPDIDEDVLCLFLPNGMENGFILGSFYTDANPPTGSANKRVITFEDGTTLVYDREAHKLTADVKGDVELVASGTLTADVSGNTTITTPTLTVNGSLVVSGNINGGGNMTAAGNINGAEVSNAAGIALGTHKHSGVSTGSGTSGGPIP